MDPPKRIEHLREVRHLLGGKDAKFNVFRYKMPDDHRAAKEGWLLGLVGPMDEKAEPY